MDNLATRAKKFAVAAHGDQMYGKHPYVYHLEAVASKLEKYGEIAQAIGYLHDVVEDTTVSKEEVAERFGDFISNCVAILTDEPGESRKERKQRTYLKMSKVGDDLSAALIVKVADRLANVEACIKDENSRLLEVYRSEHHDFKSSVFRPNLCNDLWRLLDSAVSA